jgi:hypothetical protein
MDSDVAVFKRTMIPSFNQNVKASLAPLEEEMRRVGHFREDSDGVVLLLAHSTLYPIVYGRTKVVEQAITRDNCLEAIGKGTISPLPGPPPPVEHQPSYEMSVEQQDEKAGLANVRSRRYAWLPTDVEIGANGRAKLRGYINNIHPLEQHMVYPVVETLIDKALPAFVAALETAKANRVFRDARFGREKGPKYFQRPFRPRRLPVSHPFRLFNCQTPESRSQTTEINTNTSECKGKCMIFPEPMNRHDAIVRWRRRTPDAKLVGKFKKNHPTCIPDVPSYNHIAQDYMLGPKEGRWFPYGTGRLQVMVQINNHLLTPENPTYAGGNWHVEGMLNEHIVASAIYYYDVDNIVDSRLQLRAE